MPAIRRDDDEDAVRRPSLSEIFVAESLLSWVWKTIVDRKDASSSAYLTLMPPESSTNFNWTSNTAIARTSNEVGRTSPQWYILVLVILATWIGVCIAQRFATTTVRLWKKTVVREIHRDSAPVTCKKRLAVETYDIPKETQCSALSLEDRLLALSPIQEIFDPRTRHDFAKDRLKSVRTTSLEAVPTGSTMVNRKSLANLALSEVMLTIDIAPSAPSQDEDSAIDELSELLRKW